MLIKGSPITNDIALLPFTDFKYHRSQDTLERHYSINIQIINNIIKKLFRSEEKMYILCKSEFC